MKTKSDLFIKEKPVKLLLTVKNIDQPYASKLADLVDSTYSHTVRMVKDLVELGLAQRQSDGRKKKVMLTEEGREMAEALQTVVDEVEDGFKIHRPKMSGEY